MGRCTYADGASYEGGWRDDVWHSAAADGARTSLYHSGSGDRYEGSFVHGSLCGRGSVPNTVGDNTGTCRTFLRRYVVPVAAKPAVIYA